MEMANLNKDDGVSHSFPKQERLTNKKVIDDLFINGESFFIHPLKVIFSKSKLLDAQKPKLLFTVPKKYFKRSVDRNRIKRQLRESYRKNRDNIFRSETGEFKIPTEIAFVYLSKEKIPFHTLEKKLILALQRFTQTSK